jgi:hypothetical protein
VVIDAGAIIPGLTHHGWLHTPVFILFVTTTLYGASGDKLQFLVPAASMGSHLMLDSLGGGIMWFWPYSTAGYFLIGTGSPVWEVVTMVFLFLVPAYWTYGRWKTTGETPAEVVIWVYRYIPRPVALGGISAFGAMVVLTLGQRYLVYLVR